MKFLGGLVVGFTLGRMCGLWLVRFFAVCVLALVVTPATVSAQPSIDLSGGAITNAANGQQEFFYGIGGGFKYERLYLGLDVFGDPSRDNPKQMSRGRAFGLWQLTDYNGWTFSAGGGGGKTGNETFGFGQVNADFKRFSAFGRYGSQDFVEAEGFYRVLTTERLAAGPFYRYTGLDVQGQATRLHQAGLRLTLR